MMYSLRNTRIFPAELGIFWIWQNSYVFKGSKGTLVVIDPYLVKSPRYEHVADPPIRPEKFQVDYVFCTHDHWDHTNPNTLHLIAENSLKTMFFGTPECQQRFLDIGIHSERTQSLETGLTLTLKDVRFTPLFSFLPEIASSMKLTTHYGCIFDFGRVRLYNFGDSTSDTASNPQLILDEAIKYYPEIVIFPIIGELPKPKTPKKLRSSPRY